MTVPGLLDGSVAIVTGASRGIGAAIARGLSMAGARVGLIALDEAALKELARELTDGATVPVAAAAASVADPDQLTAAINRLTSDLGPATILVNNAGTIDRGPTEHSAPDAWRRVLDTNLVAAVTAATAVFPEMKKAGAGSMVNITSLSAHFGVRRAASYGASKSGLLGLTRALALEWAEHGIRVNAVTPGYIATDFTRPLSENLDRADAVARRIPLGRWGTPEDIAGTVAYLCSPLAAYVTGQVIIVDGGYSVDG